MTHQDEEITKALKVFKAQSDECVTSLYAYLTIHAVAGNDKSIRDHVNENALFWRAALRALQSNLILALGRAYETSTEYNVGTFMRAIKENFGAFSREALRARIASRFADPADLDTSKKHGFHTLPTFVDWPTQSKITENHTWKNTEQSVTGSSHIRLLSTSRRSRRCSARPTSASYSEWPHTSVACMTASWVRSKMAANSL